MNVLSLFDGMSCGQIALERANIKVDNYYASEIDKWAIKVTQHNYPKTIQLGDINNWGDWDIDFSKIDLIMGGSPCQGFSFSGKQLAFDDPRSRLFLKYVDILNHVKELNPGVKFLLENVKMKKQFEDIISDFLGVKPVLINSSLVSAQNRKRLYWANWEFGQPEDKGIVLKNILEDGVTDRQKDFCLDANYFRGGNLKQYFEKHRRQLVFSEDADIKGHLRRASEPLKSDMLCGSMIGRFLVDGKRQDGKMKVAGLTTQRLEISPSGKTNALTTSQKDNSVVDIKNLKFRKLTPIECERLQTIEDNFSAVVSNSQRYKMLGNGWTVDVIVHILKSSGLAITR